MRKTPVIRRAQRGRSRGLSLVELLVASAIGIIASLAIFQVFAVFEGQKRTTTSGGEAQTSGALALYTIERDVRQGGYGFNTPDLVGCALQGWEERDQQDQPTGTALAPILVPAFYPLAPTLVPAFITQGVAGATDTIAVAYGNGDALPAPLSILVGSLGTTDDFVKIVYANFGYQPGEHVVIAESGKPCTLAQISQTPATNGDNTRLDLQAGTYVNPYTGATLPTRYNNPAGLGTAYTSNGKVYNVGPTPTIKVFSVQNAQLMSRALGTAAATPIFDNIVQLQAQYGKDDGVNNGTVVHATYTAGDGIIDNFDEVQPAQWAQVLAVRLAVVARSNLQERPDPDGVCRTTTVAPNWAGGAITVADAPAAPWQCFRYKVFQTVIPLRNMIWRPY